MAKKNRKTRAVNESLPKIKPQAQVSFGRNEIVLTSFADYIGVNFDDIYKYYTPPIARLGLANMPDMNAQHNGVLHARINMVSSGFIKGGNMSHEDMRALINNYLTFGDVALLKVRNIFGKVLRLVTLPSLYLRVRLDGGITILQSGKPLDYHLDDIIFLKQYDPRQQVYGIPDYLGCIQSALLNCDATLFRRRYFANGAHMGFIFYACDPNMTPELDEIIKNKIEKSKNVGNFSNMFISIPDGNPDGIKLIPVGDSAVKDDFANIKNISSQDILNAQRFPPGLAGIVPSNTAGLGDPLKARAAYREDEVKPLQRLMQDAINRDPDIGSALKFEFDCEPDNSVNSMDKS